MKAEQTCVPAVKKMELGAEAKAPDNTPHANSFNNGCKGSLTATSGFFRSAE
jgi:hypothetical protein